MNELYKKLVRRYYLLRGKHVVVKYCKLPQVDMKLRCTLLVHDLLSDKQYGTLITMNTTDLMTGITHIDQEIYGYVKEKIGAVGFNELVITEFASIMRRVRDVKFFIKNSKYYQKLISYVSKIKKDDK